jgi:glycosyltransferase involved in cell wall biosynthesis
MRVALVHYWLMGQRGGEKVLEALCGMFPDADIFTLFYEPSAVSPVIRSRRVYASALNPLRKIYRSLLPVMPLAVESFDLRGYDLVISSESGPAKGVITSAGTRHICYCHTPMRYLWELSTEYREGAGNPLARLLYAPFASYLRLWDYASAARVDTFIANSVNVKRRIWKTWRRRASVIYPPVAVSSFRHEASAGYYLMVSEMVAYKRLDEAVRAFARSGRKLKIVGGGPEYRTLRGLACPNIEFCGRVSDGELRDLYARSAALIVPCEEDFGITMVESLASGKPVIALARGGAMETVQNGCGLLYDDGDVHDRRNGGSLEKAVASFEEVEHCFRPDLLKSQAATFSEERFESRFRSILDRRRISTCV